MQKPQRLTIEMTTLPRTTKRASSQSGRPLPRRPTCFIYYSHQNALASRGLINITLRNHWRCAAKSEGNSLKCFCFLSQFLALRMMRVYSFWGWCFSIQATTRKVMAAVLSSSGRPATSPVALSPQICSTMAKLLQQPSNSCIFTIYFTEKHWSEGASSFLRLIFSSTISLLSKPKPGRLPFLMHQSCSSFSFSFSFSFSSSSSSSSSSGLMAIQQQAAKSTAHSSRKFAEHLETSGRAHSRKSSIMGIAQQSAANSYFIQHSSASSELCEAERCAAPLQAGARQSCILSGKFELTLSYSIFAGFSSTATTCTFSFPFAFIYWYRPSTSSVYTHTKAVCLDRIWCLVDRDIISCRLSTAFTQQRKSSKLPLEAYASSNALILLKFPNLSTKHSLRLWGETSMVDLKGRSLRVSVQDRERVVGEESCPLKVTQKLATSPLRMKGSLSGLGTMLSTTSLSQWRETLLMTGVSDWLSSWMIFQEGSSSLVMKVWPPLPFSAHPMIKACDTSLPKPMVCTREYLVLLRTRSMTLSVSDTYPSVRRKICLGQPLMISDLRMPSKGAQISVPPMSAEMWEIICRAFAIVSLPFFCDWPNMGSKPLPKLTTWKQVSIGRLLRKRARDSLAFSIGSPPIDPLRSSRKTYSPLAASMSVSNPSALLAATSASLRSSPQNLGMKDTITDEPASVRPSVQEGSSKFSVEQMKLKAFENDSPFASVKLYSVPISSFFSWIRECVEDLKAVILRAALTERRKSHSNFPLMVLTFLRKALRKSAGGIELRQRGVRRGRRVNWQKVLRLRESSSTK